MNFEIKRYDRNSYGVVFVDGDGKVLMESTEIFGSDGEARGMMNSVKAGIEGKITLFLPDGNKFTWPHQIVPSVGEQVRFNGDILYVVNVMVDFGSGDMDIFTLK